MLIIYPKNIDINLISFDTKFKKKILIIRLTLLHLNFQILIKNKYFKYFFCLVLFTKELLKYECLVFSFQANIYSIILCKFWKTKIIVDLTHHHPVWNKNTFKNFIFKFFLKKVSAIVVKEYIIQKELDRKFNTRSIVISNPLNKKEIVKNSRENIKFKFLKKKV